MKDVFIERDGVRHHLVLDPVQVEYYCVSCSLVDLCQHSLPQIARLGLCNLFRLDKRSYHFELEK